MIFTTRCALAVAAIAVFVGILIGCAVLRVGVAKNSFDGPAYIRNWNDVGASITKQNPLLEELQIDVRMNPPGRVRSARRMELWDAIIAEHERQLRDFKKLRAAEQ